MLDQTDLQSALSVDGVSGVDQLECSAGADDTGHTLGAAEAGDDAQANFGLAELCLLGSDADVSSQSQLAAAAQSEAVDSSDGGLGEQVNTHHQVVAQLGECQTLFHVHGSHLSDVSASDEGTACAGDDDNIDLVVVLNNVQSLGQVCENSGAQCVQSLGAVHGDDTDVALLGNFNKCHCDFPPNIIRGSICTM